MSKRLQALEDKEAIRNLIASYGPAADRGDAEAVAKLWTEDGEYDVGGFGIAKGHDEIAALIESNTHHGLMEHGCAHVLSPVEIMLDDDNATAVGYSIVFRKSGDGYEAWRVSANRWELARQSGGKWLTVLRVNRPLDGRDAAEILME